MKIKFLYVDKDGKVTLTRKELDEIMKECYDNGYEDARALYSPLSSITTTTPYYDYNRYGNNITCDSITSGKVAAYDSDCINSIEGTLSAEGVSSNAAIRGVPTTETVIG